MVNLVYDARLCTGCRACELACSFRFEGEFRPSISRIQVVKNDEEGVDIPVGCEHCDNPPCVAVCPTNALARDEKTGAIAHNPSACIGCKLCISWCPFAAIHYDSSKRLIYKCDLCGGNPECVNWCVTGAIRTTDDVEKVSRERLLKHAEKVAAASRERPAR